MSLSETESENLYAKRFNIFPSDKLLNTLLVL